MMPVEQFDQLGARCQQPESLVQFFRESPLVGVKLDLKGTRTGDVTSTYERLSALYQLHL